MYPYYKYPLIRILYITVIHYMVKYNQLRDKIDLIGYYDKAIL